MATRSSKRRIRSRKRNFYDSLTLLFAVDALVLNDDWHLNNFAVLYQGGMIIGPYLTILSPVLPASVTLLEICMELSQKCPA